MKMGLKDSQKVEYLPPSTTLTSSYGLSEKIYKSVRFLLELIFWGEKKKPQKKLSISTSVQFYPKWSLKRTGVWKK